MTSLLEYDLEIKPVHMIKGHGLCRLVVELVHASENKEYLTGWEHEIEMYDIRQATPTEDETSWHTDARQYLEHNTIPSHFSIRQKRPLRLKALAYQLVHEVIYRKHSKRVLLRCLEAHELEVVLQDLHDRPTGGHFLGNTTAHKVMQAGFYFPTLFKDAHAYACKFPFC